MNNSNVVGNSNLANKIEFYENRTAETKRHGNALNVWEKNRHDDTSRSSFYAIHTTNAYKECSMKVVSEGCVVISHTSRSQR